MIGHLTEVPGSTAPDNVSGAVLLFTDPDHSDSHSFTITVGLHVGRRVGTSCSGDRAVRLSAGTLTESTDGATGSQEWTFSAEDESFDYLGDGQSVTLTYTVEIDDGHGGLDTQDVVITVTGTNDAPDLASTSASFSATEDTALAIGTLSYSDSMAAAASNR